MGLKAVLRDFANWSTVGGTAHIANSKTWLTRIFWAIVVFSMGSVFIWQLATMIIKFIGCPSEFSTKITVEQQTFPTITVCNMNPYKMKTSGKTKFDNDLSDFMNHYEQVVNGTTTTNPYGLVNLSTTWERETRARDIVNLIAAKHRDVVDESVYTLEEIIADCTFNGFTCSKDEFTWHTDPVAGRCFTYNNDPNSNKAVTRAGKTSGLNLVITIHQTDLNNTIAQYYPLFTVIGARVIIHNPNGYPDVEGVGLTIGAGYTTGVALTASQFKLAKKPYGECLDSQSADKDYYTKYKYSMLTCLNSCRQREVYAKCGCYNPRFFAPEGATFCEYTNKTAIDCLASLKGDQFNPTQKNMNALKDCNCKPACNEMAYSLTTSLSTFPSDEYTVVADSNTTGSQGLGSCIEGNNNFASPEQCQEWYKYNSMQLQVFFETMRKETYEQAASYTLSTMIFDLGGQAGLYLGLSIVSLIECVGLVILLVLFCVTGGKVAINPHDDEYERDHRIREIEDLKHALDEHERLDNAKKRMAEDGSGSSDDDDGDKKEKDAANDEKSKSPPGSPKNASDDEEEEEKKEDKRKDKEDSEEDESPYDGSDVSDISDSGDEKPKKHQK